MVFFPCNRDYRTPSSSAVSDSSEGTCQAGHDPPIVRLSAVGRAVSPQANTIRIHTHTTKTSSKRPPMLAVNMGASSLPLGTAKRHYLHHLLRYLHTDQRCQQTSTIPAPPTKEPSCAAGVKQRAPGQAAGAPAPKVHCCITAYPDPSTTKPLVNRLPCQIDRRPRA